MVCPSDFLIIDWNNCFFWRFILFKIIIWKVTYVKSLFTQNYISQNIKNVAPYQLALLLKFFLVFVLGIMAAICIIYFFYTCWFWLLQYNSAGFCAEVIVYIICTIHSEMKEKVNLIIIKEDYLKRLKIHIIYNTQIFTLHIIWRKKNSKDEHVTKKTQSIGSS